MKVPVRKFQESSDLIRVKEEILSLNRQQMVLDDEQFM